MDSVVGGCKSQNVVILYLHSPSKLKINNTIVDIHVIMPIKKIDFER